MLWPGRCSAFSADMYPRHPRPRGACGHASRASNGHARKQTFKPSSALRSEAGTGCEFTLQAATRNAQASVPPLTFRVSWAGSLT